MKKSILKKIIREVITEINETTSHKYIKSADNLNSNVIYIIDSGMGGVLTVKFIKKSGDNYIFKVDNKHSDWHGKKIQYKEKDIPKNIMIK